MLNQMGSWNNNVTICYILKAAALRCGFLFCNTVLYHRVTSGLPVYINYVCYHKFTEVLSTFLIFLLTFFFF